MDKFLPETETLPPVIELIKLAEVSEQDVENAIASWKSDPPDEEYELIIEAELD